MSGPVSSVLEHEVLGELRCRGLVPSEVTVRAWCRVFARECALGADYQAWIVASFGGVLCVDELDQDRLAVLLAVPSGAGAVVSGTSINGRVAWKVKGQGVSYKEWQERLIDQSRGVDRDT